MDMSSASPANSICYEGTGPSQTPISGCRHTEAGLEVDVLLHDTKATHWLLLDETHMLCSRISYVV